MGNNPLSTHLAVRRGKIQDGALTFLSFDDHPMCGNYYKVGMAVYASTPISAGRLALRNKVDATFFSNWLPVQCGHFGPRDPRGQGFRSSSIVRLGVRILTYTNSDTGQALFYAP